MLQESLKILLRKIIMLGIKHIRITGRRESLPPIRQVFYLRM